ncbi:MAG: pyridoxamine 5'-phosphate oxidase family protein [Phycisphaerales bacterium]|nr:MAG: pyridoxamine 5'-phosphate oxidase family protein [Phycisphaerales bacterium]
MSLTDYFASIKGTGILATSDSEGNVDIAIYSRPYIIDEKTVAFSMLERLSFKNVQSNPKAAYMFIEQGEGYAGKRLYLTMAGEEKDPERIKAIKQMHSKTHRTPDAVRHLAYFTVDKIRALVGDKTA